MKKQIVAFMAMLAVLNVMSVARADTIDLISLVDLDRDVVSGTWELVNGELVLIESPPGRLSFPFLPPLEYDYTIEFTLSHNGDNTAQLVSRGDVPFTWSFPAGPGGGYRCRLEDINGHSVIGNPTLVMYDFLAGHRYTSTVRVRNDRVICEIDGEVLVEYETDYTDLSRNSKWYVPEELNIGLGGYGSVTTFHSATINTYASFFEDFEDGDVTSNPTWELTTNVGQGRVEPDPVRIDNLAYKGYGTPTGHRVLTSYLEQGIAWSGIDFSMEFLATEGWFSLDVSVGYGPKVTGAPDSYWIGVMVLHDDRNPGFVRLFIDESDSFDQILIPKSAFSYNRWYRIHCWHDNQSGLIRAELRTADTDELVAYNSRVPTLDYGTAPSIEWIKFGIEEQYWQFVDNITATGNAAERTLGVVYPSGGAILSAETTTEIAWESSGGIQEVVLEYSINNGVDWIVIDTVENTGSYQWQVPDVASEECLIRVSDPVNVNVNDTSDGTFTIVRGYYDVVPFPVCTAVGDQTRPDISGNIVVWQDGRNGNWDIYSYDLSTGQESIICSHPTAQSNPAVDGDTVVWCDYRPGDQERDIYGYTLSTGIEFPICTAVDEQDHPDIWGDVIVWSDDRAHNPIELGVWDIYGLRLSTGTEFPVCTAVDGQGEPATNGSIVVWHDLRSRNGNEQLGGEYRDIYGLDLRTGIEFPICTANMEQEAPTISGDIVVWMDTRNGEANRDIYGFDLSTYTEFPISTNKWTELYPAISGNFVVWQDNRNGNWDIFGYDLSTKTEFAIATGPYDQTHPAICGDTVVWEMNGDIYGARIGREEPVYFVDENLKVLVEETLGVIDPTPSHMLWLSSLYGSDINIEELTGLEYAKNITSITLHRNDIHDLTALAGLINLTHLNLYSNQIEDITPLAGLKNLTYLELEHNPISDIAPIAGLTKLTGIHLGETPISDISPLSNLTKLTYLRLGDNDISDISALSTLRNVREVFLYKNHIVDISALSGMPFLERLTIYNNQIVDLSPLRDLKNLSLLDVQNNHVVDVSPLISMTILTNMNLLENPLNCMAYCLFLPMIESSNPGVELIYDPVPDYCDCGDLLASVITVVSPGAGQRMIQGKTQLITWNINPEVPVDDVLIEFSSDNGQTWTATATVPNTGSYEWTVPTVDSDRCLIRISDAMNSMIYAVSDSVFSVFECYPPIPGDINGDCYVNLEDLAIIAMNWLKCGNPFDPFCKEDPRFVGQWNFNEEEGPTAYDVSGYANHGTLMNGPVWTDGILSFDGIDDYVEVPDSASLRFHKQLTVSAWVYLNGFSNWWTKIVIKPHTEYASPWEMFTLDMPRYGPYPRFIITDGIQGGSSARALDETVLLNMNQWYHIVGTYDGSTVSLYLDGQLVDSQPSNISIGHNAMPVCIGGRLGIESVDGFVDEVRIYNRALSESEIQGLYVNH